MSDTPLTIENIATENIFYDLFNYIEEKVVSVISFTLNPLLNVEQKGELIYVRNIATKTIAADIKTIYGGHVANNIFEELDDKTIVFHRYFIPEVIDILKTIKDFDPSEQDPTKKPKKLIGSKYTISRIIKLLYEDTWAKRILQEHEDILDFKAINNNLLFKPLSHQEDFLNYYNEFVPKYNLRGALFAGAAGSGKSVASLFIAEGRHSEMVIIVSPKNAIEEVWRETIEEQYSKEQAKWVIGDSKDMTRVKKLRFVIINYDQLKKYSKDIKKVCKGKRSLIVLDESHNFNESKSNRTKVFLDLVKSIEPDDVLLLSGTPVKAIAAETITLLKSVIKDMDDKVVDIAKRIYRAHNVIQHRLGLVSYTVEKKELKLDKPVNHHVTVDFPEKEDYTLEKVREAMAKYGDERFIFYSKTEKKDREEFFSILDTFKRTLGKEDYQEYDHYIEALKLVIAAGGFEYGELSEHMRLINKYELNIVIPTLSNNLADRFKEIRSQVKYVDLKIQGEVLGRIVTRMRIDCHEKMAKALNIGAIIEASEKKTLIFGSNVKVLNSVMKNVVDSGYNPVPVFGDNVKDLNKNVRSFHEDENVNPIVASYPALSTAVPITVASSIVIIDYPFREYVLNQAISRAHRIGQDTQISIYYLTLETSTPNIADRSRNIIEWAQKSVEKITGVESPIDISSGKGVDSDYEKGSITDKIVSNFVSRNKKKSKLLDW